MVINSYCFIDSSVVHLFTKFRPLLCHINLRGCFSLTPKSFKYIALCQNLQDLNLSECQGITVPDYFD